jgi:hypothetical protein
MKKSIIFRIAAGAVILTGAAVVAAINRKKKSDSQLALSNPEELKNLYHSLAHKYHPDQSKPGEEKIRDDIMKKVNRAYQEKDIEKLRAFL